jgi:hypothetical protein
MIQRHTKNDSSNMIGRDGVTGLPFIKRMHTQFVYYALCIQEHKIDTDEEGKVKQFNISWEVGVVWGRRGKGTS